MEQHTENTPLMGIAVPQLPGGPGCTCLCLFITSKNLEGCRFGTDDDDADDDGNDGEVEDARCKDGD